MTIRLVDSGWRGQLTEAMNADASALRIVSPFIKTRALDRLLEFRPKAIEVITRFCLEDFADGVSDIAAARRLLKAGARVRGVKNLHAKLYLFGSSRVIVTSANLTLAALDRNHEFGFISEDREVIADCAAYFADLWKRAGADLTVAELDGWDEQVTRCLASGKLSAHATPLPDYGADVGIHSIAAEDDVISDTPQAFVKFLGDSKTRAPLSRTTIAEIESAGCHHTVCYPASKRPTGVADGARIFISRLTRGRVPPRGVTAAWSLRSPASLAGIIKQPRRTA